MCMPWLEIIVNIDKKYLRRTLSKTVQEIKVETDQNLDPFSDQVENVTSL